MLEKILEKLGAKSIDEYKQERKKLYDKYDGYEIEIKNPWLLLTVEEMDYLIENGYV